MKHNKPVLVLLGIFLFFCAIAGANIPKVMNFQGILTDTNGNPLINDTLSVEFKIYDAAVGGNAKWSENLNVITNSGGVFNAFLGSSNPIPESAFDDTLRWLSIKVGSDPEMQPRTRITSVAYSFKTPSPPPQPQSDTTIFRVFVSGNSSALIIFTVPQGKTRFITGIWINTPSAGPGLNFKVDLEEILVMYNTQNSFWSSGGGRLLW